MVLQTINGDARRTAPRGGPPSAAASPVAAAACDGSSTGPPVRPFVGPAAALSVGSYFRYYFSQLSWREELRGRGNDDRNRLKSLSIKSIIHSPDDPFLQCIVARTLTHMYIHIDIHSFLHSQNSYSAHQT